MWPITFRILETSAMSVHLSSCDTHDESRGFVYWGTVPLVSFRERIASLTWHSPRWPKDPPEIPFEVRHHWRHKVEVVVFHPKRQQGASKVANRPHEKKMWVSDSKLFNLIWRACMLEGQPSGRFTQHIVKHHVLWSILLIAIQQGMSNLYTAEAAESSPLPSHHTYVNIPAHRGHCSADMANDRFDPKQNWDGIFGPSIQTFVHWAFSCIV